MSSRPGLELNLAYQYVNVSKYLISLDSLVTPGCLHVWQKERHGWFPTVAELHT